MGEGTGVRADLTCDDPEAWPLPPAYLDLPIYISNFLSGVYHGLLIGIFGREPKEELHWKVHVCSFSTHWL